MKRPDTASADLPPAGVITITAQENGWHLVQIGRARAIKRLFLSDAEARQLGLVLADRFAP